MDQFPRCPTRAVCGAYISLQASRVGRASMRAACYVAWQALRLHLAASLLCRVLQRENSICLTCSFAFEASSSRCYLQSSALQSA